jgi:HK97 family phage major capsid protein
MLSKIGLTGKVLIGIIGMIFLIAFDLPIGDTAAIGFMTLSPLALFDKEKMLKGLREERSQKLDEMELLVDKAENEKRDFTPHEEKDFKALRKEADSLEARAVRLEATLSEYRKAAKEKGMLIESEQRGQNELKTEWRDLKTGNPVYVLNKDQKFTQLIKPEERNLSLGKVVRALTISNWKDAEAEQRALSTLAGSAGVTVPVGLYAKVLDLARGKSILSQAGAKFVPMENGEMTIARITQDPAFESKAENEKFTLSDIGFDGIKLKSFTIGTIIPISRELAADSPNAPEAIENAIASALAAELDKLGFLGGGITEPRGIINLAGVHEIPTIGVLSGYNKFIEAWVKILNNNGEPNGYVISPREAGLLEMMTDDSGQYLNPPRSIEKLQRHISSKIPTNLGAGTNESLAIMGDFSKVIFGVREDINIEVSLAAGEAFERHQALIKVTWRGDVTLERENQFTKLTGITAL